MADDKKKGKEAKKKKSSGPKAYKPRKFCPKCGPGVGLAAHKDRASCGKCGYFEKK